MKLFQRVLIDRSGRLHEGFPPDVPPDTRSRMAVGKYHELAVRNYGAVAIELYDTDARIRFRPDKIAIQAFHAAWQLLPTLNVGRYALIVFDARTETWREISGDGLSARERLAELVEKDNPATTRGPSLTVRDVPFEALEPGSPLIGLRRTWAPDPDWGRQGAIMDIARNGTNGRYVLFAHEAKDDGFVFADYGHGLPAWGISYLKEARGLSAAKGPDRRFGRACVAAYRRTMIEFQPRLQKVDAIIDWPGYGPLQRCYTRLLLPFIDPTGRSLLLSASIAH